MSSESKTEEPVKAIDRRTFLELTAKYGETATVLTLASLPVGATLFGAAEAYAATEAEKKSKADHVMIFGLTAAKDRWPNGPIITETFNSFGFPTLKAAIERNSKGKIYLDAKFGGALGSQVGIAPKVQQGVVAGCQSTTQNIAVAAPVWNVLDIPYTIGPVDNWWRFLFSKEVNDTLRKTSEEQGIINLYIFPDTRWLEFGKNVTHDVRLPEHLNGLKIRVTGSKGEQASLAILPCSPTPIAWPEVFGALKDGAIDGLHASPCSVADAGIHQAVGQMTNCEFMGDCAAMWVSVIWLKRLSPTLQEAVREAGYEGAVFGRENLEKAFAQQCGLVADAPPSTIYGKLPIKKNILTDKERQVWVDTLSLERNGDKLNPLIDRYGRKEFETVIRVAQSNASTQPQRWWKA